MFERFRHLLLHYLKVPPEPEPPWGAPGSVRVFRAGQNYYRFRLLGWSLAQLGALTGILFSIFVLHVVSQGLHQADATLRATSNATNSAPPASTNTAASDTSPPGRNPPTPRRRNLPLKEGLQKAARASPAWLMRWGVPALVLIEVVGVLIFIVQALTTYAALRLDYELRWYMVTDRSLRIRNGVWRVQEITMSFANLQQVELSQGPIQRLLGIADVKVESAGGGGAANPRHHHQIGDSMHTGFFHGVENATEVRDLILERLRRFRETGLGDPDELTQTEIFPMHHGGSAADTVAAARELLAETKSWRAALSAPFPAATPPPSGSSPDKPVSGKS